MHDSFACGIKIQLEKKTPFVYDKQIENRHAFNGIPQNTAK